MSLTKREPAVLRKKVDWVRVLLPGNFNEHSFVVRQLMRELNLKLQRVGRSSLYRDRDQHIALHLCERYIALEFEGQYFDSEGAFELVRDFIRKKNSNFLVKPWRITRLDLAIDLLDVEPLEVLPVLDPKFHTSFKCDLMPRIKSDTRITETVYLCSNRFDVRAYRKDIEVLTHDSSRKSFGGYREFNGRPITRLEFELAHLRELKFANNLVNADLPVDEIPFLEACLSAFIERKSIRIRNENSTPKTWPLIWAWELIAKGIIPNDLPECQFEKVPVKQDQFQRALKAAVSIGRKMGLLDEEIIQSAQICLTGKNAKKAA